MFSQLTRRGLLRSALAAAPILAAPSLIASRSFAAENWAKKPVTIICHTAPGSAADIYAREVAAALEPVISQTVVVENRTGGNGMVQMAALRGAKADGLTLAVNTVSHLSILHTAGKGTFSIDDFDWVARVQTEGFFTVVRDDSPFTTLAELVEHAKTAQPLLNVGGQGAPGSAHNIHTNILADAAGFKFNWIPFQGGVEHLTALLGGSLDFTSNNPQTIVQFAESKRIRLLGYQGSERLASFPDVATYNEQGINADPSWQQIRGIFAPKGLGDELKEAIATSIRTATENSEGWKKYMTTSNLSDGTMGPVEYEAFIRRQNDITLNWLQRLGLAA